MLATVKNLLSWRPSLLTNMFCPTAVDEFFEKKFSQLDINFNKKSHLTFKDRVSFEDRVKAAEDSRSRFPNKVPLIIERHKSEKYLPELDKVRLIILLGSESKALKL